MRRIVWLILIGLALVAGKGWAGPARVAVFVNLERLPGFRVILRVEGVHLLGKGREEVLPLVSREIDTGLPFGQGLLAFGEVPAGKYRGLKLCLSGVKVRGREWKGGSIERVYPVSLDLRNGETTSLFVSWDVAGSLGGKAFVPRFSVRRQENPLPGENLFVDTPDTDTVWVITTDTNRVVYSLGICEGPRGMAVAPGGQRFYVVCEGERAVKVVGMRSFRVEDVIPVPLLTSPRYLALGPEGRALITSPDDRMLALVDLERGVLVRSQRLNYQPGEVVYLSEGQRFAVSSPVEGVVYFFDTDLNPAGRLSAGFAPRGLASDREYFYVTDEEGGVHFYRLPGLESEGRVETCFGPERVLSVDGRVLVSCSGGELAVLLEGHLTVSRRLSVGRGAFSMVYYAPRRWVYVALREAGAVAVVDFNRERVVGKIEVGGRPFELVVNSF
ncbi:YncE family protein [Thermosulfurimonas sp. F29]|uniref:YncE family protein n=1 Tax=Thermosulfurimonas sp. F29 TaxID=2867247 RepID=UPI001C83206A|nr:hypothetical protein [Thermosulfurimonas sp. F29]MBX6422054.1 hypothetical protein [Thermosulfurimonas sp. F29]